MKLSLFSVVDPPPPSEERDRLGELLALAREADAQGLEGLWVAEHHFGRAGALPTSAVLLAAAAAQTRRLRLGCLVSVLPYHEPVEVAEEYAVLDRLSGGRLNFGCGSGYVADELAGFGVDPATKRDRFDRALRTIRAAWAGEEVRVERPDARPVRLNVRPVQLPHPPLTIAVQRREAVPYVARWGASLALIPYATLGGIDELRAEIAAYRAAGPPGFAGEVRVAMHVYAGASRAHGERALQSYLDSRLASQSAHFQEKVAADPEHARADTIDRHGLALLTTPDELPGRLGPLAELGIDELLAIVDFGGLPLDESLATVRALGRARRARTPLPRAG